MDKYKTFEEWLHKTMPNKPNTPHTVFSIRDMGKALEAGKLIKQGENQ